MIETSAPMWAWAVFGVIILGIMAIDLGLFDREAHIITAKTAIRWVGLWASLAVAFNVGVYFWFGGTKALQFSTGYIIEYALSVDNIFVFIVLFEHFRVPKDTQHRVLFWGVLGAFVLRAIFIFVGAAVLNAFHWMIFVFGGFLIFTGVKILLSKEADEEVDPAKSIIVRGFRRLIPMSPGYVGQSFITVIDGKRVATPLLLVLFVVEGTDVVFAADSIPAIFAVTTDPFIVYTSNVFAILGLRNLYFVLADFMDRFEYLKVGLGLVLVFVGVKMTIADWYKIHVGISLLVVASLLAGAIVVSWLKSRRTQPGA